MIALKKIQPSLGKRVFKNVTLGLTAAALLGHAFEGLASQTLNGEGTSSQTEISLIEKNPVINPAISKPDQKIFISSLPDEILLHMTCFLDRKDLMNFRLASKETCSLVTKISLLKNHPHAEFTLNLWFNSQEFKNFLNAFQKHSLPPLPIAHLNFAGRNLKEWKRLSSLLKKKKYTPSISYATFLRSLDIGILSDEKISLNDLKLPSRFPKLQKLTLRGFSHLTDISELRNLPLEELTLTEGSNLTKISVRQQLPNLQRFNIISAPRTPDFLTIQEVLGNPDFYLDHYSEDHRNEMPTVQEILSSVARTGIEVLFAPLRIFSRGLPCCRDSSV